MAYRTFPLIVILLLSLFPVNASAGKFFGIVMLANCAVISDEYRQRVIEMIEAWHSRHPELGQLLQDVSTSRYFTPEYMEQYDSLGAEKKQQMKQQCDQGLEMAWRELDDVPGTGRGD